MPMADDTANSNHSSPPLIASGSGFAECGATPLEEANLASRCNHLRKERDCSPPGSATTDTEINCCLPLKTLRPPLDKR